MNKQAFDQFAQQAEIAGFLFKEQAEPLHIMRTGKGFATLPPGDHHVIGGADALSDDPL